MIYKVGISWLMGRLGVGKFLRERVLHVPDSALQSAAAAAGVTPMQWRSVESVQVQIVEQGLQVR